MTAVLISASLAMLLAASGQDAQYEQQRIEWALELHQRELDPAPQGKQVEEVLVAREDVFSKTDPAPTLLNIFHGRTREYVVLREVLLKPGDTWSSDRALETERNLRTRSVVFAVARVVAVKGRAGGASLRSTGPS